MNKINKSRKNAEEAISVTVGGELTKRSPINQLVKHHFYMINDSSEIVDTESIVCIAVKGSLSLQIRLDRDYCYYIISNKGIKVFSRKIVGYGKPIEFNGSTLEFVEHLFGIYEKYLKSKSEI